MRPLRRPPVRSRRYSSSAPSGGVTAAVNTQADTAFTTQVALADRVREWRCFERFGASLRTFLRDAPIDISCDEVEQMIQMFIEWGRPAAERMVEEMYAEQVREWVQAYRASFEAVEVVRSRN